MTEQTGKVVELDVREDIKGKLDPFNKIMDAIKELKESGDTLILHAPFNPTPLIGVMKAKGFTNESEELESKHWKVTFKKK